MLVLSQYFGGSMSMWFWQILTRFGETSLLLPVAILLFAWLVRRGETANAARWFLAFATATSLTLISKLAFMGWGMGVVHLNFTGFSGHSMMAAAVLPVLFHRLAPVGWRRTARCAAAVGIALALAVGYSRLMLHAHSWSEMLGGLCVGLMASLGFLWQSDPALQRRTPAYGVMALLAALLVLPASGTAAPTQDWLERIAVYLSGRDRPFRREDLLALRWAATSSASSALNEADSRFTGSTACYARPAQRST